MAEGGRGTTALQLTRYPLHCEQLILERTVANSLTVVTCIKEPVLEDPQGWNFIVCIF